MQLDWSRNFVVPNSPEYSKAYYAANLVQYRAHRKRQLTETTEIIHALKARPCEDCQKSYPWYVMEFDHVRGKKFKNINCGMGRLRLAAEVDKCDVVCANCHAIRTYQRKGKSGGMNGVWRGLKKAKGAPAHPAPQPSHRN